MNIQGFGLSPQIQALLDSDSPDWSTVTLDNVHDAFGQLKVQVSYNRRRNKSVADVERSKTLGRHINTLLCVKAAKWAERGEAALADAIARTRASLGKSDYVGLYAELYLDYLIAEANKLHQKRDATEPKRDA